MNAAAKTIVVSVALLFSLASLDCGSRTPLGVNGPGPREADGSATGTGDDGMAMPVPPGDDGSSGGIGFSSVTSPSCASNGPGLSDCGAARESCCTSLEVPGGTFYRTYKNSGRGPTGEADPATVSRFWLDKFDVTVGRFRRFVTAWNGGSGWTPPAGSGKHTHVHGGRGLINAGTGGPYEPGWLTTDNVNVAPTDENLTSCHWATFPGEPLFATWTTTPGSRENLPINCVSWYEAYAFCIWDGGFLPSEAEWEYAAAGGNQQREYPWGSTAPGNASLYAIYDCYYHGNGSTMCTSGLNIAPVGTPTSGAGRWGHLDLVGNMEQFTLDWSYAYGNPCVDCARVEPAPPTSSYGPSRTAEGGYFGGAVAVLYVPFEGNGLGRDIPYGFRCARTP